MSTTPSRSGAVLEVLHPGLLTLVEDLGRPGHAHLGVGASGAADRPSLRLANRLVGNRESAAALEITLGEAAFRLHIDTTVALTGAPAPITVDGREVAPNAAVRVHRGESVRVGRPSIGLRTYLAVRGGIAVPVVLGSRSRDTLADLGPPPLRMADMLPVGDDVATLRIRPGPRVDRFTPEALETLAGSPYTATPSLDRVGIRLRGVAIRHRASEDLPPEGIVTGAVQIPPDGQPVLFLADHPVTGGYPVLAVVAGADQGLAAQIRPGQTVRFRLAE
jgi:biotin-dependent carboxylase-like uncharacterized protein